MRITQAGRPHLVKVPVPPRLAQTASLPQVERFPGDGLLRRGHYISLRGRFVTPHYRGARLAIEVIDARHTDNIHTTHPAK